MQKDNRKEMQDQFVRLCKAHGLKITPQRIAIFMALAGSTEHPSADNIYRSIHREYPHISFETVNRTLLLFVEKGLLDVVESFSGARRFDPHTGQHHHIHCIKCGQIVDVFEEALDQVAIPESISKNYHVLGKRVVVHVICPACQSNQTNIKETL